MIKELDRAALAKPLPEHGLEPGDVGSVVMVHKDGEGYTLEFMTLGGEKIAIATVSRDTVRPLRPRDRPMTRSLELIRRCRPSSITHSYPTHAIRNP